MQMRKLFTIGFAGKSAEQFFSSMQSNRIKLLIDVRLSNESQLAGYTKKKDLAYFLSAICSAGYLHAEQFAPTKQLMDAYKGKKLSWDAYVREYLGILAERDVKSGLGGLELDHSCLLCSEAKPTHCHRRLLAEFIAENIPDIQIIHL